MNQQLLAVDKVEITTLQDNYIDILARDGNAVVQRANPLVGREIKNSVLAEHGFSALVTITSGTTCRSLLFDFGFSEHGAAFNANALSLDLSGVEIMALSHGHPDHIGGLKRLSRKIGKSGLRLVAHPAAFRSSRRQKVTEEFYIDFPAFTQRCVGDAGVRVVETEKPLALLDDLVLFLGEIPRSTPFENVPPIFFYEENGQDKPDSLEDDTALVFHVKDQGLVVLSGCAHSGIVNTVEYARKITGVEDVFAIMGGYHLCHADLDAVVAPTVEALQRIDPTYVIPTHCTGKIAADYIQNSMPNRFLLNMSGTRMVFTS